MPLENQGVPQQITPLEQKKCQPGQRHPGRATY